MQTARIVRPLLGAALLAGLIACFPAHVSEAGIRIGIGGFGYRTGYTRAPLYRSVGYRHGGYYSYYRPRSGFGLSVGVGYPYYSYYRPRYSVYSYYRPSISYYGPTYYGYSYYRPRYYSYSYYRPYYYGYSYYRPRYYAGYAPYGYAYGGVRYHGSYGCGSACCY